ncbi:MAG: tetratricopeptide repeat protein [Thermoplasmatota archaeon]
MEPAAICSMVFGATISMLMIAVMFYASRWKKVPPDMAMLIYKRKIGQGFVLKDILTSKGKFIVPFFQKIEFLPMDVRVLEISAEDVVHDVKETKLELDIKAVTQIKACSDPEGLRNAVEHQLQLRDRDVNRMGTKILEKHIRLVALRQRVYDVIWDRDQFASEIVKSAEDEMHSKGLITRSFVIKSIDDKIGFLDAMGRSRTESVMREAGKDVRNAWGGVFATPNPKVALGLYQVARIHLEKGDLISAVRKLRYATMYDPSNREYMIEYMRAVGEPVVAETTTVAAFKEFIRRRETAIDKAWEYHLQGKALMEEGRFEEAEIYFRKAMETDPFETAHKVSYHASIR